MASKTTKFIPVFAIISAVILVIAEAAFGIDIDMNTIGVIIGLAVGGGATGKVVKEIVKQTTKTKEAIPTEVKDYIDKEVSKIKTPKSD